MSLEAVLSTIPHLRRLSPGDVRALAAIARLDDVPAGEVLFREGNPSDAVWLISSGRIALSLRCPGAPEAVLLTLGPGELVGWSALLEPGRRVATGRVRERAVLVRFDRDAIVDLCERDHDIGYALMRLSFAEVSARLQQTRLQLLDLFGEGCGAALSREPR